jgi:hypothetical protein
MSDETPKAERKGWEAPQVVEVGGVVENTGTGNENVRDNPENPEPAYTDPPKPTRSERVDMPEGE